MLIKPSDFAIPVRDQGTGVRHYFAKTMNRAARRPAVFGRRCLFFLPDGQAGVLFWASKKEQQRKCEA